MQTVAETPTFTRQAEKLFSEDEKQELITFLAENPLAGDEIPERAASERYASQPLDAASVVALG
jgi:hypothetical protein